MNSVERNVSNYTVPSDTMNQFQNITTFVKNATLKNCKLSEASETDISKWFGDMLIKYCEAGLTESDIYNLLSFVRDYNIYLDKKKEAISKKEYIIKTNALTKAGNSYDATKKYYLKKEYSDTTSSSTYINRYKKVSEYEEGKTYYIKDYEGQYFEVLNSKFVKNTIYFTFSENIYTQVDENDEYNEDIKYYIIKKVTNPIKRNISKYCVRNDSNNTYTAQSSTSEFNTNITYYIAVRIPHLNEKDVDYYEKIDNTYELVESSNPNEKCIFDAITERNTFYSFTDQYEYKKAESYNEGITYYTKNSDGSYVEAENITEFNKDVIYYYNTLVSAADNTFPRSVSNEPTLTFSNDAFYAQKLSSFHYINIANKNDYDEFTKNNKHLFKVNTIHQTNFKESTFCIYYTKDEDGEYYIPNFKNTEEALEEDEYDITFTQETTFTKDTKYYEEIENVKVDTPDGEIYTYYTNEEITLTDTIYNYVFSYYPDIYALIKNYFLESTDSLETKEANIKDIVTKIYDEKDKIQIGIKVSSGSDVKPKYVADETELTQIQKGESNIFFILTVNTMDANLKSLLNDFNQNTNTALLANTANVDENASLTANIYILYKELNPYYREILSSDMIELVDGIYKADGDLFEGSHLLELVRNESTIQIAMKYPRSADTSFLVKDTYSVEDGKSIVSETTQTFKYLRGNAYIARKSSESDIIAYYYGDNYISNGYGRYKYEIREIENFLTIFKETRDFYYQVLLNYSFINEEAYQLYEKMFISFWSIERFLSSKIESVKDIDSYDLTDCENFFKSFGFEELGNKISLKEYYDCEEYAKAIIKNYVKLAQNKGNKQVISNLETILSVNNTTLNIYKHTINKVKSVDYIETTEVDPSNIKEYYIFNDTTKTYEKPEEFVEKNTYYKKQVKTSYLVSKTNFTNNNITESLLSTTTEKKDLVDITSNDIYWDASHDTPAETLVDLNLSSASTKYISAELIAEMSEYYFTTRVIFAIIDWLFTLKSGEDDEAKKTFSHITYSLDESVNGSLTLGEYITAVKQLYSAYYTSAISNGTTMNFKNNSKKSGYSLKIRECKVIEGYYDNNYNVDETKLSEFYSDISTSQKNIIIQILEDAQPLRFTSVASISGYIHNKKNSSDEITMDDIVGYVVKPILNLFKIYLNNGIITADNIYIPFDGGITDINKAQEGDLETGSIMNLLYHIIDHFYINASEDNNMMFKEISNINYQTVFNLSDTDSTLSLKNKLLEVANDLSDVLDTVISFGITQSTESISFLKTTIDYFISYTTEILSFTYAKAWNSTNEAISISEDYKFKIESTQTDNFFFDDKLIITKQQKKGGN